MHEFLNAIRCASPSSPAKFKPPQSAQEHDAPIHTTIIKNGQQHDHFVVFELLRACSRFDAMDYAIKVFRRARRPNVYVYTALIDGLVASSSYHHAVILYVQMIENLVFPDNFVINSVLKACGLELDLRAGKQIHAHGLKLGLGSNRQVKLKLMEFYGKCGEFDGMNSVFDEMPERDVVAMTVLISSYLEHKLVERACAVFDLVKSKDTVCWTAMIDGRRTSSFTVKAIQSEKPTYQVIQPINGDPFIGSLETPVTSSPLIAWYLSNLPAYRTAVNPLLRGVEVGLAHGFLLVGPFVKTGPLRNTPIAGGAGSLAAGGLVVILSICLTIYGIASFKEGEASTAPSLTLTGRKKVRDQLQTADGWAKFTGGFFFGGISGVVWAYFLLYVLDLPYFVK